MHAWVHSGYPCWLNNPKRCSQVIQWLHISHWCGYEWLFFTTAGFLLRFCHPFAFVLLHWTSQGWCIGVSVCDFLLNYNAQEAWCVNKQPRINIQTQSQMCTHTLHCYILPVSTFCCYAVLSLSCCFDRGGSAAEEELQLSGCTSVTFRLMTVMTVRVQYLTGKVRVCIYNQRIYMIKLYKI